MIEVQNTVGEKLTFVVKSKSGKILLRSVDFINKEDIHKVIQSFGSAANERYLVERRTDCEGMFLFHLLNHKRELIGRSGLYSSEAGMENGIKNFKACL